MANPTKNRYFHHGCLEGWATVFQKEIMESMMPRARNSSVMTAPEATKPMPDAARTRKHAAAFCTD